MEGQPPVPGLQAPAGAAGAELLSQQMERAPLGSLLCTLPLSWSLWPAQQSSLRRDGLQAVPAVSSWLPFREGLHPLPIPFLSASRSSCISSLCREQSTKSKVNRSVGRHRELISGREGTADGRGAALADEERVRAVITAWLPQSPAASTLGLGCPRDTAIPSELQTGTEQLLSPQEGHSSAGSDHGPAAQTQRCLAMKCSAQ